MIVVAIFTQGMVRGDGITVLGILQGIICLAVLVGAGIWWWFHYERIRHNEVLYTTEVIKRCAVWVFYGTVAIAIIFALIVEWKKLNVPGEIIALISFGVPFAFTFFFLYLPDMATPNYEKYAKKDKGAKGANLPEPSTDKNYAVDDFVWARWSGDNNLYFARITESLTDSVKVEYYDGATEERSKDDIFYLDEAQGSGLTPYGNWKGKGSFYPCDILELNETTVHVKYTQDGIEEQLPYQGLVFWNE
jgi:hypothetical protein